MHKKFGMLFGSFCLVLLGWHMLTPSNPQHIQNVIYDSMAGSFFFLSTFLSIKTCRYVQTFVLLVGAFFTAYYGNLPVSAVVIFVSFMIFYAYGGFHTISTLKIVLSTLSMFLCLFLITLSSGYGSDYASAYAIAMIWTAFPIGLFWSVWLILQYFAADIVQQNRDLLELNKELTKGDCNVTKKRG